MGNSYGCCNTNETIDQSQHEIKGFEDGQDEDLRMCMSSRSNLRTYQIAGQKEVVSNRDDEMLSDLGFGSEKNPPDIQVN